MLEDSRHEEGDEPIDDTPLTFGKYKGQTPNELACTKDGRSYLLWAFPEVQNKDTCSRELYDAIKEEGIFPPKGQAQPAIRSRDPRDEIYPDPNRQVVRAKDLFDSYDDMDDDIPF